MNTFLFVFTEAWANIRRSPFSFFATIITTTLSLVLVGAYLVASNTVLELMEELRERTTIEAYLEQGLNGNEQAWVEEQIQILPGVSGTRFVSQDSAMAAFKAAFGDKYSSLLEQNALPASVEINLLTASSIPGDSVVALVGEIAGVEDVLYRSKTLEILSRYNQKIRDGVLWSGGLLLVISFFLVLNHTRVVMHARQRMIKTMELVGATRLMIAGPFLMQGILESLVAFALASGALKIIATGLNELYMLDLALTRIVLLQLAFVAVFLGFIASFWAVRARLRSRVFA